MLIVDDREPKSLQAAVQQALPESTVQRLSIADYLIFDTCGHICAIERKHVSDLLASITGGKLVRQVANLKQHERPVLLVEGSWLTQPNGRIKIGLRESNWVASTVQMILLGIQESTGVSQLWVSGREELIATLAALVKQGNKGCFLKGVSRGN